MVDWLDAPDLGGNRRIEPLVLETVYGGGPEACPAQSATGRGNMVAQHPHSTPQDFRASTLARCTFRSATRAAPRVTGPAASPMVW